MGTGTWNPSRRTTFQGQSAKRHSNKKNFKNRQNQQNAIFNFIIFTEAKGLRKGGLGLNSLSFLFCKKPLDFAWEIICFRMLFACCFVDLMEIPRNKFACMFQGTLWMGQRVIIMFWWESGLLSASRNYLTTFCRSFVYYARLRLCSAMVYFIRNSCLYFVC